MSIEKPWKLGDAYELVTRAGPYLDLSLDDFEAVIEYLAGGGRVLGLRPLTARSSSKKTHSGSRHVAVARDYYMNIGTISDDFQVKIVNRANRRLGEVEEGFLASLRPDEAFTIGGRAVVLDRLHQTTAVVRPAQGERIQTPRWMGPKMPLTAQLAQEERRLRTRTPERMGHGRSRGVRPRPDRRIGTFRGDVLDRVLAFLERQNKAAPIPADDPSPGRAGS